MDIHYSLPISRAWLRMKILLMRPFDIGSWFVLGFSAFLAGLAESGNSFGSNFSRNLDEDFSYDDLGDFLHSFGDSFQDYLNTGLGLGLIMFIGVVVLTISILLIWLSSRGKFIFLDNLVHNRTEITRPWSELAPQADSLFFWQLGYALICLTVLGLCGLFAGLLFGTLETVNISWVIVVPLVVLAGTIAFILVVALLYIDFFLTAFVVPIMHRERIGTMAAWSRFLRVFRNHPGSFFMSGLLYLVLSIAGTVALGLAGLLTCCIGLVMMAIPYVGNVITLPLSVFLRYFTLDFLGQFGDEFRLLDAPDEGPVASTQFNSNRTMIGTEDVRQDGSVDEPGPQNSGD